MRNSTNPGKNRTKDWTMPKNVKAAYQELAGRRKQCWTLFVEFAVSEDGGARGN
jgi:hypothetical protein